MITLTVDSALFLVLIVAGPLIFGLRSKNALGVVFLLVSTFVYALTVRSVYEIAGIISFLTIPLVYLLVALKRPVVLWPFVTVLVCLFIILNGYTWITGPVLGKVGLISFKTLGLSYILFRQIDVMVHARAGRIENFRLVDYFNYLFSYYTVLAGPIQRFKGFLDSFRSAQPLADRKEVLNALHRAANGMLKILVVAVLFKDFSDGAYAKLVEKGSSLGNLLTIFYCYPLFVYFNFSGYCDVVIAMARWAGFSVPENFDRPYLARNMIEFWNRWHITLSQWLRDYVYQPLFKFLLSGVLARRMNLAQYLSIFVTFFLAGVWHGTSINFVVFGLLHGLGMAFSMIYRDRMLKFLGKKRYNRTRESKKIALIEIAVTLHFVCFTFLFFEYDVVRMVGWLGDVIM